MRNLARKLVCALTGRLQIRGSSRLVWKARHVLLDRSPVISVWGGTRMRIDRNVRSNVLYSFHLHTFEVVQIAQTVLEPGGVLLDVGANAGYVTITGAQLVGPSGRVLAVEPQPPMLQLLRENVAQNSFSQVTIFPNAISQNRGTARFSIATDPGLSRLTAAKCEAMTEDRQVDVETLRLDDVVSESGVDRVDLLKMDIEGYELEALKSGPVLLSDYRPACVLEVNRYSLGAAGGSAEELRQLFIRTGYRIFGIDSHQDKWFFPSRKPALEEITGQLDLGSAFDILCVPTEKLPSWIGRSRDSFSSIRFAD